MKKLTSLRQSAERRTETQLRLILKNETRWSSTFELIQSYFELKEYIDVYDEDDQDFIPSAAEDTRIRALSNTLKDFESVSKHLQKDTVQISDARALFDSLLEQFPELQHYLGLSLSTEQSTVVHLKAL